MDMTKIPARQGNYNLKNYETSRKDFDWEEIKKEFSWYKTGKVNAAYEAIDKHAEDPTKKKIKLPYNILLRVEKNLSPLNN